MSNYLTFTLTEAQKTLKNLCWLLSYVNGGFITPIYIEGEIYNSPHSDLDRPLIESVAALARTDYQITPLEQLGSSWLMSQSNLRGFISCYSNFEKMLDQPFWKGTFYFVLVQYFQAIRGSNWERQFKNIIN